MWTKMLAELNAVDGWLFGFCSEPLVPGELDILLILMARMTHAAIVPHSKRVCRAKRRSVESRMPPIVFRLKYARRVSHDKSPPEFEAFRRDEETVLAESDDGRGGASEAGTGTSAGWSGGGGGVPPRSAGCRGGKGATPSSLGLSASTCTPSRNPISPRFCGKGPAWGRTSVASDEDEAFDAIERKEWARCTGHTRTDAKVNERYERRVSP